MPLEIGFTLNTRYRIQETIAIGGMGAIYRATDDTLGIQVAVKENFFTTTDFSRQFRREATILASLRHPNLPRVTDHFVINEQGQYLVMDFIEGEDLRQIIANQGILPELDVLKIGITISEALAYLHTRNPAIVHRDIKPGNIKVTPTGQVILVDFGLAKVARGEATTTGAQALTPGYAPPEQYGQGTEPRSDLYALGATLYATLTGKIPEDGLSRAMGTVELTPIRKHNPIISEQTARVIEKAMAVRPDERYPSAESFTAALQGTLALTQSLHRTASPAATTPDERTMPRSAQAEGSAASTGSRSDEPTYSTPPYAVNSALPHSHPIENGQSKPATRRLSALPMILGITGIVFLTGLIMVAVNLLSGRAAFLPQQATATTTPDVPTLTQPAATAAPSLTPSAIPTLASPSDTPEPTATATEAPPTSTATPAATPAGGGSGQIAFASHRSGVPQVWVMNAEGQNLRQLTNMGDGACQPAWSPDGLKLVFVSPCAGFEESYAGASLFIIQADGTGLLPLVSLPGGDYQPDWSPDGSQIVFTSLRDGRPHIFLYALPDNTVTRLSPMSNYEQYPNWSPDGTRIAYQTTRGGGQPKIWMMAADGSSAKEFSTLSGGNAYSPEWSPLGDILVYTQAANQRWLIARQVDNPAAGEFKVTDRIRQIFDPNFSPDGWWLSFSTTVDDNTDIYRIQRNGGDLTRLTDDPGVDFHPAWQP
jgi:serine/threonine protein kinase